jgi:colanic acid/amylovoran biosynthesis glycosyltransferase
MDMESSSSSRSATPAGSHDVPPTNGVRPCVAYIMSRFPKLTETFVLDEILELERRGIRVEVFPLWREPAKVIHQDARPIVERAHFTPTIDLQILGDNLLQLTRTPVLYLGTLGRLLFSNRSSLRFWLGALAIFPKAVSFARRMQALGVQHVHAHFASHPAAAAFVVGRFGGISWSFTAHGSDLHREQAMLREKVAEARFVVTISEFNRRFILDHVDQRFAEKIKVIHCGVDPEAFEEASSRNGHFEFACVGTLHEVKGQRYLLDACAGLSIREIDWRCHLVGDGPDRVALEEHAESLGLGDRVIFHGACERDSVLSLLSRVDASVAPSVPTSDGRREGIPVVLMEAAACGLPLVASRLSGIPEIVRDEETGLLVEPRDAKALESALARLAVEPDTRARLGGAARRAVEQDFRLSHNVDRLEHAFFAAEVEA